MGNIVTITNNYNNGVCNGFYIYTGTTFNGDPYTIPNNATLISNTLISLPHQMDMGSYTGPLYVFVEHCDNHTTPPPGLNPKKQGGFQVEFINIDCGNECPEITDCRMTAIFREISECGMGATFSEYISTDCDIQVSFVEYNTPTPLPTATATPLPIDCDIQVSFVEYNTPTPLPTATSTPLPIDCDIQVSFVEYNTPTPTATPTATPNCDLDASFNEECFCVEFTNTTNGDINYGYIDCDGNAINAVASGTTPTFSICLRTITSISNTKLTAVFGDPCVNGSCV